MDADLDARADAALDEIVAMASQIGNAEAVDHPPHYNAGTFEVIDVIEDWSLGFNLGNSVKYIARADHKGKPVEDLKKALWYLTREIARRER